MRPSRKWEPEPSPIKTVQVLRRPDDVQAVLSVFRGVLPSVLCTTTQVCGGYRYRDYESRENAG